jgi:hypothetical protein
LWSVVCALWPATAGKNCSRVSSYPHFSKLLKYDGIKFPIALKDIPKFKMMNALSINIFTIKEEEILPLLLNKTHYTHRINLLLLTSTHTTTTTEDDDNDFYQKYKNKKCLYHFAYIKNLSRLVNHQIGNIKNKTWFCERCFNHFSSEMILKQHLLDCKKLNDTKIVFPETERIMEFKGFKNKIKVPFVIYADLENILVKYNESGDCGGVDVNKKMHKYQKHEPFSIAYYLKCSYDDTLSKFNLYTSKNSKNWFVQELKAIALELNKIFKDKIDLKPLNLAQENDFNSATTCYICEKLLAGDKVKEHCHLTGEYTGAAHNSCDLNYQDSQTVPVIFHHLSGYQSFHHKSLKCRNFRKN